MAEKTGDVVVELGDAAVTMIAMTANTMPAVSFRAQGETVIFFFLFDKNGRNKRKAEMKARRRTVVFFFGVVFGAFLFYFLFLWGLPEKLDFDTRKECVLENVNGSARRAPTREG
jgi:hypothetical protein